MNWVIKSVSLPLEQAEFVEKHKIKLSRATQEKIKELMDIESGAILESNAALQAKIERLSDTIQRQREEMNVLEEQIARIPQQH